MEYVEMAKPVAWVASRSDRQTRRRFLATGASALSLAAMPGVAAADDVSTWPRLLTASQAAARIRRGELRAEYYVSALIAQADYVQSLDIFISQDRQRLLSAARDVDLLRARGRSLGPLAGVPLLVKDNIDAVGFPTTAGTPALAQNRPTRDAPLLARLLQADALVFGKMNMDELAFGVTSGNATYGPVHNPYAFDRVPGGSSGGTAAGIAARVSPIGLGTDTAGSGRGPASLCGVVGFRPSIGRYPVGGTVPTSHTRDTIAPFGRTMADVALIHFVLTGHQVRPERSLNGVRFGIPRSYFWNNLDPETEAVANAAVGHLRAAGAVFVEVDLPGLADLVNKAGPILSYEAINDLSAYLKTTNLPITVDQLIARIATPSVAAFYQAFLQTRNDIASYTLALETYRPRLQALYANCFEQNRIQALCFPTTPVTAVPIGQQTVSLGGSQVSVLGAYLQNVNPGSSSGQPGLVIPAGLSRSGLPVGLEFDGPVGSDDTLLAIGLTAEPFLPPVSRRDCGDDADCLPPVR